MGGFEGNVVPVNKDSTEKNEKFEFVFKANGEGGYEHISCDECDRLTEEELSRKQKMLYYKEAQDVLSIAQTYYQGDNSAECGSNSSATSSEKKRKPANLLDNLVLKRPKHNVNSADERSLNSRKLVADGFDLQKDERSGSSGKRSRDSCYSEAGLEGGALSGDDSAAKRRKIRHASNNMQLKMLGPLKLPDYVNGLGYDYELDPEIIKLNKQLLEINEKLRDGGTIDNCPEDEHSPSPPGYNEIGIRLNTREKRLRAKLGYRRQQIICELNLKNPLFRIPSDSKPSKFTRKLYVPVKQFPNYNFIGLIIGPRGHTQKRMERESGARILLRGKGSTRLRKTKHYKDPKIEQVEDEDLHVYIEAEDENALETASDMVEKLLVPVNEEANEHKQAQLRELAELNMEISSEVLNAASPSNLTTSKPAPEIENNSLQTAHVSSPHYFFKSQEPALTSPDTTRLDSASGGLILLDAKPGEVIDKAKLFVGFLPLSLNTEKLIELFSPYGHLCEAVVIMDRRTGLSKGYGFVKYNNHQSAAKALVHMNGSRVDGKVINVRLAGRAPLKVNTIIGPRALRFANSQCNPVSAATCGCAFTQGIAAKCWNHWALFPEPPAFFPKCSAFPLSADPMYRRRPHVFAEISEKIPFASSNEFMTFPHYHQHLTTNPRNLKCPVKESLESRHTYF